MLFSNNLTIITMKMISFPAFIILISCLSACNNANQEQPSTDSSTVKATADSISSNPEKNCYFGDLHLHTAFSADAFLIGAKSLPDNAFEYAMGQEEDYMGGKIKRNAPLDFLAVTDHAEYLGVMIEIANPKGPFTSSSYYKAIHSNNVEEAKKAFLTFSNQLSSNQPDSSLVTPEIKKSNWQRCIEAADKYNHPGKFTALVGYEWTSAPLRPGGKGGRNLHRCIIFKGDKVPAMPFSAFDSQDPEDLWTYLETARKNGDDVIAIPHNGNASNGLMFDTKTLSGKPLTKEYAERRMANEPLTEIAQGKGQSETHPQLSPNDEFANYELWETLVGYPAPTKFMTGSYVRQAYGVGQEFYEKLGVNPFKYGLEGGTDYHSGFSSTEENNYPGTHANLDAQQPLDRLKELLTATTSVSGEPPISIAASSLTGVWAEKNTREDIFNALKRKECFGTSGNREQVRMFASWNYPADIIKQTDWVKTAYSGGVPMGSDLPANTSNAKGPTFIVQALKDPNMANLDRIQIIKVTTKNGKSSEKIFDVVWAGNRKPDPKTGKVPMIGTTVDMKTATYTNTIGAASLIGFWTDPDFDPKSEATYYARVLEIPTPRWSTILAVKNNLPLNKKVQPVIVERAWTSPVWYTPQSKL
jgi:Protein of unknown function (DUF3604)